MPPHPSRSFRTNRRLFHRVGCHLLGALCLVTATLSLLGAADSIRIPVSVDRAQVLVTKDSDGHHVAIADETARYPTSQSTLGAPRLPAIPLLVEIPAGATVTGVRSEGRERLIGWGIDLAPQQHPIPFSGRKPPRIARDGSIYNQGGKYPRQAVSQHGVYHTDSIQTLSLKVSPVRYEASRKRLYLSERLTVIVDYTMPDIGINSVTQGAHPGPLGSLVRKMVANQNTVADTAPQGESKAQDFGTLGGTNVDLLIITNGSSLVTEFNKLGQHRQSTHGFSYEVKTVGAIASAYSKRRPDGGNDNQTAIRRCIQDYVRNHGTQYVVLGGDNQIVPVRYCLVESFGQQEDMPTDWYYACLDDFHQRVGTVDDIWDIDGDGIYGESIDINDDPNALAAEGDLAPDVIVGRIPIRTAAQARNYITKLKNFENSPPPASFFRKMLMAGVYLFDKYDPYPWNDSCNDGHPQFKQHAPVADDEIWSRRMYRDKIQPHWQASTELGFLFDSLTSWDTGTAGNYEVSPEHLNETINRGWYFMNLMVHGRPDAINLETWAYDTADINQITSLTPVITTLACQTGAFDTGEPSFSEAFLRKSNSGSLIYIGCSREGIGEHTNANNYGGPSSNMLNVLYQSIFRDKTLNIGQAFAQHKIAFMADADEGSAYRWLYFGCNLQGDPCLQIQVTSNPTPPEVRITAPASGATVSTGQAITVRVDAQDDGSIQRVKFYRNGAYQSGKDDTSAPYQASISGSNTETDLVLQARAIDNNGNSAWSQTVTVQVRDTSNRPPQITAGPSANPSTLGPDEGSCQLSVSANDPDNDPLHYEWTLQSGPGYVNIANRTSRVSTAQFIEGTPGTYRFRVRIDDGAAVVDGFVNVTVQDDTPSTPLTVQFTSPAEGAQVNPTFSCAVNASGGSGVHRVVFYLNNQWLGADTTAPFGWSFSNLQDGEYTIRAMAVATDNAQSNAYRTVQVGDPGSSEPTNHWPFTSNDNDVLGNINGIMKNGASLVGGSLVLDGENDWVAIDHNKLEDEFTRYSVSLWFRAADVTGSQFLYEEGGNTNGFGLRLNGNKLEAFAMEGGVLKTRVLAGINPNVWYLATATYDNGILRVYKNGEAGGTINTGFGTLGAHSNPAAIGGINGTARNLSGSHYFKGEIDDVRIFDGYALDASEVQAIRNEGRNAPTGFAHLEIRHQLGF